MVFKKAFGELISGCFFYISEEIISYEKKFKSTDMMKDEREVK